MPPKVTKNHAVFKDARNENFPPNVDLFCPKSFEVSAHVPCGFLLCADDRKIPWVFHTCTPPKPTHQNQPPKHQTIRPSGIPLSSLLYNKLLEAVAHDGHCPDNGIHVHIYAAASLGTPFPSLRNVLQLGTQFGEENGTAVFPVVLSGLIGGTVLFVFPSDQPLSATVPQPSRCWSSSRRTS